MNEATPLQLSSSSAHLLRHNEPAVRKASARSEQAVARVAESGEDVPVLVEFTIE